MLENLLGQLRGLGRREGGKKVENPSNRSGSPCKWFIAWVKILITTNCIFLQKIASQKSEKIKVKDIVLVESNSSVFGFREGTKKPFF